MHIEIKSIPSSEQRYDTVGDYWYDENDTLQIRLSDDVPEMPPEMVLLHELTEIFLCQKHGVKFEDIDNFDMNVFPLRDRDESAEPGDEPDAPYRKEHRIAMIVEHIFANAMGVDDYGVIR
jgi:hypothetical protein